MNTPLAFAFILFAVVLAFAVYHIAFRDAPQAPFRARTRDPQDPTS